MSVIQQRICSSKSCTGNIYIITKDKRIKSKASEYVNIGSKIDKSSQ